MYTQFVQQHIAVPFYAGMKANHLGIDSREHCFNRRKFDQHPLVDYCFNEVGFRTHSVYKFQSDAILVIGDSFTVGLGSNVEDRFTDIIEQELSHQVLNFSLNGASNDWISRKLEQLVPLFKPKAIIIHYTFSHRRERPYTDWHDDERTECEPYYSSEENYQNWKKNFNKICSLAGDIKIVHSFIPNWHDQSVNYAALGNNILSPVLQIDQARDGFHYGVETHRRLAKKITTLLAV
jgi:hypothetical protein